MSVDLGKREYLASFIAGILADTALGEQDRLFLERCQEWLVEQFRAGTMYVQQGLASDATVRRLCEGLKAVGIEASSVNFRMDPHMLEVTV